MCDGRQALAMSRAAQELELKSGELELARQLGEVRTVPAGPAPGPGWNGLPRRRAVPAEEVERLRAEEGFPDALRGRIRTVGSAGAAELIGVGPTRFLRLAKAGCFAPVRFYVNRYSAVVWLYLAAELTGFAEREPGLLRENTPAAMRVMLDAGGDWRGRQWRGRRVSRLMEEAEDRWESAAVIAAVLPPEEVASVVEDPSERSLLRQLKPVLATVGTTTPAAREAADRVLIAQEFDEVMWYRVSLSRALEGARAQGPARRRQPSDAYRGGQPPSFRNSPSWTTDTRSLPSRS
ncbi:hypothetical protein KGS77_31975 [Streptomyces sp. MST-110588]|nr:hypothetical protein KGS77_31975 [Streptomyces sp. MST-110588]